MSTRSNAPWRASLRATTLGLLLLAPFCAGCGNVVVAPSTGGTDTFTSSVVVGGLTAHSFRALTGGTIKATLTSTGPAGAVVGLGIGLAASGVSQGCALSTGVVTAAGTAPQVSAAVDGGVYCVAVYDVGQLKDTASFSVTIEHP